MPLTPLPESNTKRYFVGQQAGALHHEIQIRVSDAVDNAAAVSALQFVFGLVAENMFDDCFFDTLNVAENGSDIRNPVAGWTTIGGGVLGAQPNNDEPLTLCARGRSTDGRKVRLFLWGMQFTRGENWELIPTPDSGLDLFLERLNASPNLFLSISGAQPVWQGNYTVTYNDAAIKNKRG
jgi:hypothetical protein